MKKYELQITRAIRAERPSKEQLVIDSANADVGNVDGVSQSPNTDNFFNLDSTQDLQQNVDRILSTMSFNPFAMGMGNGWRVVEYPHSDKWTQDYIFESKTYTDEEGNEVTTYPEVWVQYIKEEEGGTENFEGENALIEAQAFINGLQPSDGWVLGKEWGKTIVIDSRASLWVSDDYVPLRGSRVNPLLGRIEKDRY